MTAALRRSVASLEIPNYRRFFRGQVVSISGNWMQTVAETWLILMLTGSGLWVGAVTASQFVGMLVLGAWGGTIADRFDKRKVLIWTQLGLALPVLCLAALSLSGAITPLAVLALVLVRGAVNAIDYPTRQSFVIEMVGPDRVVNAVSLNSVMIHSARMIGPAVAAGTIALWGVEPCFVINAMTFGYMALSLASMDRSALQPAARVARRPGAVRAGLRYVRETPALLLPLGLMALVGTLGLNFHVILPLLARFSFDGGATAYAVLVVAMALGSVVGALANGARGNTSIALISASAASFGVAAALAATMPTLALEAIVLMALGASAVTFAATVNSSLQLAAAPEMRGRVMALYSVVFLGSTAVGAPLVGAISELADPRAALAMAAVAGLTAAAIARRAIGRSEPLGLGH